LAKPVESRKEYRNFGITVGIAFLLLSALFWWKDLDMAHQVTGTIGALLLLGGLIAPGSLKWPFRAWMKFAMVLNWISTRIILTLTFYIGIASVGLLLRLLGKRPLAVGFDKNAESYWIKREKKEYDPVRSEKHF
jgi:hypothetical protein